MKIALGSDHRGTDAARALEEHLRAQGHEPVAVGVCEASSCDYPDNALAVGRAIADGVAPLGILVCGSGIGVSIAANKVRGVRAALAQDAHAAAMSRRHNDANVLCMSGDRIAPEHACSIADAFLAATFEGGRHARRVEKIMAIEEAGALNT